MRSPFLLVRSRRHVRYGRIRARLSASVHVLGRSLRPGAAVVVGGAVPAHRQKRELEQRERGSCRGSCPGAGDSVSGHPGGTGIVRPSHAAVSDQPAAVAEPQAPERVAKSVKVPVEPVAAAPAVAPSAPAPMPVFDQPVASDAHTDASVEALPSFAPSSSPSANVPVHAVDDAAQTQSDDSHKSSSDDLFSSMYLSPESKLDFDIPDLSFPTLNTGEFYSGLSGFGKDND